MFVAQVQGAGIRNTGGDQVRETRVEAALYRAVSRKRDKLGLNSEVIRFARRHLPEIVLVYLREHGLCGESETEDDLLLRLGKFAIQVVNRKEERDED